MGEEKASTYCSKIARRRHGKLERNSVALQPVRIKCKKADVSQDTSSKKISDSADASTVAGIANL